MSVRIENESFAGDAFMRHPIFLFLCVPRFSRSCPKENPVGFSSDRGFC